MVFQRMISNTYRFYYKNKLKFTKKLMYGKKSIVTKSCSFEGYNKIMSNCDLSNTHMGYASFMGNHCSFINTYIGKYVSIGDHVSIVAGNHPTSKYVCNHPAFYSLKKQVGFTYTDKQTFEDIIYQDDDSKTVAYISDGVWIGSNTIILNGVKIGEGAIIAAGSVVVKDVAPYEIVGGVPARKIRDRFTEEQKEFLLNFKLYEKDIQFMRENVEKMEDIDTFIKYHKNENDEIR